MEVRVEKSEKIFQVIPIPPLEGAVTQASLEACTALTSGFTIIELDLIPGEKPDEATKIENIT